MYPYVDTAQEHVEKLENVRWKQCNCGYTVLGCQENATKLWESHTIECGHSYLTDTDTVYRITLKDGETVTLRPGTKYRYFIYAEQDDPYGLAYSTDGKTYTGFVDRESKLDLNKRTLRLVYVQIDEGELILRRTDPAACTHEWAVRHIYEEGHLGGLHEGSHDVQVKECSCGFKVTLDPWYGELVCLENLNKWENHIYTNDHGSVNEYTKESPYEYIVDVPSHDETYCIFCGSVK